MTKFDLDRVNLVKVNLGSKPIKLKRKTYPKPRIKNDRLVDKNGNPIGTKGDMYTKKIMDRILREGCFDHNPRPHYEDIYEGATYNEKTRTIKTAEGKSIKLYPTESVRFEKDKVIHCVPAYTLSVNNGIECTYDLSKGESPMITLRPIATKSSCAEILWIYQKQSNDLVEFDEMLGKRKWDDSLPANDPNNRIFNWWDEWAVRNEDGSYLLNEKGHPSIWHCYGGTTQPRDMIRKEVIDTIKGNKEKGRTKDPDSRRLITCLWQIDDFTKPHALKPCAFLTIWNVRHEWDGEDYLDMTMVQRSSDFAVAGCINQVQYAELLMMVARDTGLKPGVFTWKPVNVQIYDRHFEQVIEMLNREPVDPIDATIKLREEATSFEEFTADDFKILDEKDSEKVKTKNPKLFFPLGI